MIDKSFFIGLGFPAPTAAHIADIAERVPAYGARVAELQDLDRAAGGNLEAARSAATQTITRQTAAAIAALREGKPYKMAALLEARATLEIAQSVQARLPSNERFMPTAAELEAYRVQEGLDKAARQEAVAAKRAAREKERQEQAADRFK